MAGVVSMETAHVFFGIAAVASAAVSCLWFYVQARRKGKTKPRPNKQPSKQPD